jgi:hypothetical protein
LHFRDFFLISFALELWSPVTDFEYKKVQVTLIIRCLFICGFAYLRSKKVYQNSELEEFPSLIHNF